MKTLAATLFALFLFIGIAVAQDAPATAAAPAGAEAFLAGLTGFDEAMAGETELAVLINGMPMGTGKLVVGKAPEGSGGVYQASIHISFAFGPMKMTGGETTILDEKFALVSTDTLQDSEQGGDRKIEKTKLTWADGKWTRAKTVGEETTTQVFAFDGPNHESLISGVLLARKLAGEPSGKYVFKGIDWKKAEGAEAVEQTLTFTVKDAATVTIAGQEMKVRELHGAKAGDPDVTVFTVGEDGRFISFASTQNPLKVIASDLVETKAAPEPVAPGTDSPRAAAVLYLKVLAGAAPVSDLNKIMDWPSLHQDLGAGNANIAALDIDTFRQVMLDQFQKQVGVIDDQQVDLLAPLLKVAEDEGKATVIIPGQDASPFHLKKLASGWVITKFPR